MSFIAIRAPTGEMSLIECLVEIFPEGTEAKTKKLLQQHEEGLEPLAIFVLLSLPSCPSDQKQIKAKWGTWQGSNFGSPSI